MRIQKEHFCISGFYIQIKKKYIKIYKLFCKYSKQKEARV